MNEPTEIAEGIWLDTETNTVIVGINEKITISFEVPEFWDFCEMISSAQLEIKNNSDFVIGTYEDEGVTKTQLFLKSDTGDIN
jgi:hypothetical protein